MLFRSEGSKNAKYVYCEHDGIYIKKQKSKHHIRILKNRGKAQPLIVGGYSNFLFLNREGLPKVAGNYDGMVRGLIKKYNKYHTDKLPNITPHSFRHTYCTNMANRGMNPNTLQYLMGHANITMTLGYYAHGTFQSAKAELERLAC